MQKLTPHHLRCLHEGFRRLAAAHQAAGQYEAPEPAIATPAADAGPPSIDPGSVPDSAPPAAAAERQTVDVLTAE